MSALHKYILADFLPVAMYDLLLYYNKYRLCPIAVDCAAVIDVNCCPNDTGVFCLIQIHKEGITPQQNTTIVVHAEHGTCIFYSL